MAWSAIEGQPLATRILSAHVRRGRLPAAYLFTGPDGVGKRRLALEYARAINCESPADDGALDPSRAQDASPAEIGRLGACGRCRMCGQIERGVCPDVHVLSRGESGAIKLDDLRQAFERVQLRPFAARYQVAIILDADRLTDEAANSLLKTLEEPPASARFVLTTLDPAHCLPTIVSRCQLVRFRPLPDAVVQAWLVRDGCDPQTAATVAPLAHGSAARAKELVEAWDAHGRHCQQLASGDPTAWLGWAQPEQRPELAQWLARSIWWLRDLSVAAVDPALSLHHADHADAIRARAAHVDRRRCLQAGMRIVELWESLEHTANPKLVAASLREQWVSLLSAAGLIQ